MTISEREFELANRRGEEKRASFPAVISVMYDRHSARIVISLATGLQISFSPDDVQGFENSNPDDLTGAEITPSGLAVHFPKLDADIYVPALLEGFLGSKRWHAEQMGKRGGEASSNAKTTAARTNGRLGGRPRKSHEPTGD